MNHIQAAIEELKSRAHLIQTCIAGLEKLLADKVITPPSEPESNGNPRTTTPTKTRGPYKKRTVQVAGNGAAVVAEPVKVAVHERPTTFGGAMKLEIVRLKEFTAQELREAMEANWPELVKEASSSAFPANLSYWIAKQKLEKLGTGPLAKHRIAEPDFFKPSED